jgi:hypothetical protein
MYAYLLDCQGVPTHATHAVHGGIRNKIANAQRIVQSKGQSERKTAKME